MIALLDGWKRQGTEADPWQHGALQTRQTWSVLLRNCYTEAPMSEFCVHFISTRAALEITRLRVTTHNVASAIPSPTGKRSCATAPHDMHGCMDACTHARHGTRGRGQIPGKGKIQRMLFLKVDRLKDREDVLKTTEEKGQLKRKENKKTCKLI